MIRVLCVFGTRPEAIKMAPVIQALRACGEIDPQVCVTAQHRSMLDETLQVFDLSPDFDLDIMRPGQTLAETTSAVLERLTPVLDTVRPQVVLVHGDTTTTFASGLASFYRGVPVGHVEAGLRTGDLTAPWPEEFNRRTVDMFAELLWAPTEAAAAALRREGVEDERIIVTGNTVVDALQIVREKLNTRNPGGVLEIKNLPTLDPAKRMILVTGHRRESFDGGLDNVCKALNRLARRDDVEIVWPVHPNPKVREAVSRRLDCSPAIHTLEPVNYLDFVALMSRAYLIITDSGGIQEEAPTLAKPVLVTRAETERPEAVAAGTAKLVGVDTALIVREAENLLDDPKMYAQMAGRPNPFGDGRASTRIVDSLMARFG